MLALPNTHGLYDKIILKIILLELGNFYSVASNP
jgi:hypothetical protein